MRNSVAGAVETAALLEGKKLIPVLFIGTELNFGVVENGLAPAFIYALLHVAAEVEYQVSLGFEDGILQVELRKLALHMRIEACIWRLGRGGNASVIEKKQTGAARVGKRAFWRAARAGILGRQKRARKGDPSILYFPVAAKQCIEKAILSCGEPIGRVGCGADSSCGGLTFGPNGAHAQADAIVAFDAGAPAGKRKRTCAVKRAEHGVKIVLLGCSGLCHVSSSPCVAAACVRCSSFSLG